MERRFEVRKQKMLAECEIVDSPRIEGGGPEYWIDLGTHAARGNGFSRDLVEEKRIDESCRQVVCKLSDE